MYVCTLVWPQPYLLHLDGAGGHGWHSLPTPCQSQHQLPRFSKPKPFMLPMSNLGSALLESHCGIQQDTAWT